VFWEPWTEQNVAITTDQDRVRIQFLGGWRKGRALVQTILVATCRATVWHTCVYIQ